MRVNDPESSTLRITAGVTDATAAFMLNRTAALRAGAAVLGMDADHFFMLDHMQLNRFGDGIRAGGDAIGTEPGRFMASNPDHLFHRLACLYPGAPRQRNEATDGLTL